MDSRHITESTGSLRPAHDPEEGRKNTQNHDYVFVRLAQIAKVWEGGMKIWNSDDAWGRREKEEQDQSAVAVTSY